MFTFWNCLHVSTVFLIQLGILPQLPLVTSSWNFLNYLNYLKLIVEMTPNQVLYTNITLADVHLNLINRFHFPILVVSLLVFLISSMSFQSPFLDVKDMPFSDYRKTVIFTVIFCWPMMKNVQLVRKIFQVISIVQWFNIWVQLGHSFSRLQLPSNYGEACGVAFRAN